MSLSAHHHDFLVSSRGTKELTLGCLDYVEFLVGAIARSAYEMNKPEEGEEQTIKNTIRVDLSLLQPHQKQALVSLMASLFVAKLDAGDGQCALQELGLFIVGEGEDGVFAFSWPESVDITPQDVLENYKSARSLLTPIDAQHWGINIRTDRCLLGPCLDDDDSYVLSSALTCLARFHTGEPQDLEYFYNFDMIGTDGAGYFYSLDLEAFRVAVSNEPIFSFGLDLSCRACVDDEACNMQ